MVFIYYDTLSSLISGCVLIVVLSFVFEQDTSNMNSILSLALAYVLGYILNAISGLVEPFYFWTMGGRPSDKLLTTPPKNCSSGKIKEYTGYGRIKFFHYDKVIKMRSEEHTWKILTLVRGKCLEKLCLIQTHTLLHVCQISMHTPFLELC